MNDYSHLLIKQYKHWGIYIHENQSYLGRCVIWCDRRDALHLTDATESEHMELLVILKELQFAIQKAFEPDWVNFAFLGNETRHLHGHFIPRYSSKKEFSGIQFEDKLWGHNYQTDKSFTISPEVLKEIQDRIKAFI